MVGCFLSFQRKTFIAILFRNINKFEKYICTEGSQNCGGGWSVRGRRVTSAYYANHQEAEFYLFVGDHIQILSLMLTEYIRINQLIWPFSDCGGAYGLCLNSRAWHARTSPSGVYPAGELQWRFNCGFDFGRSLRLPFVAGFPVLKGLLIVSVGTVVPF